MSAVDLWFETKEIDCTTNWLVIEHEEGKPPAELLADLAGIGWNTDGMRTAPPAPPILYDDDGSFVGIDHKAPKVEEIHLLKRGTALFTGWTPNEKRINMADVRKVLRRHGFTRVPVNKLTLADLL